MWKIIIVIMICIGFYSMSFAQDMATNEAENQDNATNETKLQEVRSKATPNLFWLTIDNKASFGATVSSPYVTDPNVYYNVGLTFGGNITKYIGVQTSLSITPSMGIKGPTELLIDVMLIVQKDMGLATSGFRPYLGIGMGSEFAFESYHDLSYLRTGFGLATEAGLRYYYKDFLVGISLNYNLYASKISVGSYEIGYYTESVVHSEVRAGLNIGFLF